MLIAERNVSRRACESHAVQAMLPVDGRAIAFPLNIVDHTEVHVKGDRISMVASHKFFQNQ
jgi:hypothetical protein